MDSLSQAVNAALAGATPADNRIVSNQLQSDLFVFIAQSYSSIECVLFRAESGTYKEETAEDAESERVGRLEQKEAKIDYQGAEIIRAVEYPKDMQGGSIAAAGLTTDDELYEDTLLMLFSVTDVPEQSLVIYNEMIADDVAKMTALYVLDAKPVGKHGLAGKVYRCIPLRGDVADILSDQKQLENTDNVVEQQNPDAVFIETGLHGLFEE